MMKKYILIMLFTLAGLAGMAQTNEPLPGDAEPLTNQLYLSPSDSTVWAADPFSGLAIEVGTWFKVDSLFKLGYTKGQVDSAIFQEALIRETIAPASATNVRNDQASFARLLDGRLIIAYSRFGTGTGDADPSDVYYQTSSDEGSTWTTPAVLISAISLGSYIPSLYVKENGNVMVIFFVRESTSPYTSSIRQVVFSPDLENIVSPVEILVSGGYHPVSPDRIFKDKTGRLIYPYPELVEGPGTFSSAFEGHMLVSDNDGDTWTDLTLALPGKLNYDGFGGVLEPGVFENGDDITYYFRTYTGSVYAYNLNRSGSTYTNGSLYNLGIRALNAQVSIKFVPKINIFLAAYTRFIEPPTSVSGRKNIDIATSFDAKEWSTVATLGNTTQEGGLYVNEPTIYIDTLRNYVVLAHTHASSADRYDLKITRRPVSSFSGHNMEYPDYYENPNANEYAFSSYITHILSQDVGNRYGSIDRTRLVLRDDVTNSNASYYGHISYLQSQGLKPSGIANHNIGKVSVFSPQLYLDSVRIRNLRMISINSNFTNNIINGTVVDTVTAIQIDPISHASIPLGTFGSRYAIKQLGVGDSVLFNGPVGLGGAPKGRLSVYGSSIFSGTVVVDNRGPGSSANIDLIPGGSGTGASFVRFYANDSTYVGIVGKASNSTGDITLAAVSGGRTILNVGGANKITVTATEATASVPVVAPQYRLSAINTPPASATATGTAGTILFGSDGRIYICTATNTWIRSEPLTTW